MSELIVGLSLTDLTSPINGGSGEDLSFSSLFDQIKEARRADPDYLTQGDWQTDLKASDWERVITLAAQGLATQSKDLMLVAWLNEGLAHTYHFVGITFGLTVADRILEQYWTTVFPSLEDGIEERATRLTWLKTTLTEVVGTLPITQGEGYGLLRYEESRHVENLALQNASAMRTALDEGKINVDIFQRSVVLTDTEHFLLKSTEISGCLAACRHLQSTMDRLFEQDAPSFSTLDEMLLRTHQMMERLLKERGIETGLQASEQNESTDTVHSTSGIQATTGMTTENTVSTAVRTLPLNRDEAFTMLAGIAQYFKQSEPQSPVPYLIERAIKWGNMPLESWLKDVIKDSNVVDSIRDVLGTK